MDSDNTFPAHFATVISLDSRFAFVVGGSEDPKGINEVESENLVLIDMMKASSKIKYKTDLTFPVIHPACSIFDKRLLFIVGGQC